MLHRHRRRGFSFSRDGMLSIALFHQVLCAVGSQIAPEGCARRMAGVLPSDELSKVFPPLQVINLAHCGRLIAGEKQLFSPPGEPSAISLSFY
jgi:hypothetical protein